MLGVFKVTNSICELILRDRQTELAGYIKHHIDVKSKLDKKAKQVNPERKPLTEKERREVQEELRTYPTLLTFKPNPI